MTPLPFLTRLRDCGPGPQPRHVPAKDTALYHGALRLISEQDRELDSLRAQNRALRGQLREHGIEPAA